MEKNWGIFMVHCLLKINLFLMYTNKDTTKMVDFAVYIRNTWDKKIIHSKNIYNKNLYNTKTFCIKKCIFSYLKSTLCSYA